LSFVTILAAKNCVFHTFVDAYDYTPTDENYTRGIFVLECDVCIGLFVFTLTRLKKKMNKIFTLRSPLYIKTPKKPVRFRECRKLIGLFYICSRP
jgi:hypothetical protein